MKKRYLSLVMAALLSILTLTGLKTKKEGLDAFLEELEDEDNLKKQTLNYQETSILKESNKIFEHRAGSKVLMEELDLLLKSDISELEREIITKFLEENNVSEKIITVPENTSLGFIISNRIQKCSVEVDIQFTKDNVPVLFHDNTLEKATGGLINKKISDFTYEELSKIKIFYNQKNYSYIPTLEEILILHNNKDYFSILIEIKTNVINDLLNSYQDISSALENDLEKIEDRNRAFLMSGDQLFILNSYEEFKKLGIKTGITLFNSKFLREFMHNIDSNHYDFISFNIEIINKDLIESAIKNNKAIFIGSSSKENIKKIIKLYQYLNIYENFYILTDKPNYYDELLIEIEKQKQLVK